MNKEEITKLRKQGNGAIPFFDTLVTAEADNSLSITVYHKPTHTDQYLQWNSHHNLSTKYSVIGTLTHRTKTVCTRAELFRRNYNTLGKPWSSTHIPTGPLVGFKTNTSTTTGRIASITTGRIASTTTTYKTTVQMPAQAWINHIKAWTVPILHKAPTIQIQAQKKHHPQGKTQHRICCHPLHKRHNWKFQNIYTHYLGKQKGHFSLCQ